MNETHHVRNSIAYFSNHREFEKYSNIVKGLYSINSAKDFTEIDSLKLGEKQFWNMFNFYTEFINKNWLINRTGVDALRQVCHVMAVHCAVFATGVDDIYYNNEKNGLAPVDLYIGKGECKDVTIPEDWERSYWAFSKSKKKWELNIEQTLKMAQISVASFIFVFLLFLVEPEMFNFNNGKSDSKR